MKENIEAIIVGNIRPSFIKIRAIALCEEYPDQFSPNDGRPICNCDSVHKCVDCKEVMVFDGNRQLCEKADNASKCKAMRKCEDCGHVVTYKKDQKQCGYKGCQGKFSGPYSKNGFTDPYQPHENSFDHNKKLVEKFTDLSVWSEELKKEVLVNKRMRNWIAGYITRYKQRRVD
jgi:ribosomal protein S17E